MAIDAFCDDTIDIVGFVFDTNGGLDLDAFYDPVLDGFPPTTPPIITILTPTEGTTIGRTIPLSFTVTANVAVGFLRRVVISAQRGGEFIEEMIHDGVSFAASYNGGSNARTVIANGYQYSVLRLGGWRGSSVTLRIIAIDVFGNIGYKTIGNPQALYTWPVAVG